jgi:predicted HAD superfamily hydrolase
MPHLLERFGFSSGHMITTDRSRATQGLLGVSFNEGLKSSLSRRQRCASYIEQHFEPSMKAGLVDIGWNGNIQRYLIGSLNHRFAKEQFVGLYLGLHSNAMAVRDRGFGMQGWLSNYGDRPHVEKYLWEGGVELLEFALTADHGTTLGFEEDDAGQIRPILEKCHPEETIYREKAMKVQAGIRKFVQDHRFLLSIYRPEIICSAVEWSLPFEKLVTDPTGIEIALLSDLTHCAASGDTLVRLPLAAKLSKKYGRRKSQKNAAREKAFWKAAFDRLNE